MKKFKPIFVTVLLLAIGIVFINNSLFSLAVDECSYCADLDDAETKCAERCGDSQCAWVSRTRSVCDEGDSCVTTWKLYCESGSSSYYYNSEYCFACENS